MHVCIYVGLCVCMYVCVYVCIRVCVCVWSNDVHSLVYARDGIDVCMYVLVCACICVCTDRPRPNNVHILVDAREEDMCILMYTCTSVSRTASFQAATQ